MGYEFEMDVDAVESQTEEKKRKFNGICGLKLIGFTYRLSMDSYLSFYFMYCIIM